MAGYSFAEIDARIKGRLNNESSRMEGSFAADSAQAVAQELAMIHSTEIAPILDAVFLDTAAGGELDRRALDFGEVRQAAQAATGRLRFRGTAGALIPAGTLARVDALLFETVAAVRIAATGEVLAAARCQTAGVAGNVPAGVIRLMAQHVAGVSEVTNPEAFAGGTETETDAAFRERLLEKIRRPVTSGNEYYYEHLAEQVPGILRARCTGTWAGPGTVKLVLLSSEYRAPDETVMAQVQAQVEAQRLIGAEITYLGAEALPVNLSGRLVLMAGYLVEDVAAEIAAEFSAYFEQIAFDGVTEILSYHKAIELAFRAAGVLDIEELLINGAAASVVIGPDAFCWLEGVDFSA